MIDVVNILEKSVVCDVVESEYVAAVAVHRVHLSAVMGSLDTNSKVLMMCLLGMYQKKIVCLLGIDHYYLTSSSLQ